MIGISLSGCVRDILNGVVKIEDVTKIIAGTCAAPNTDRWARLMAGYKQEYWYGFDAAAIDAVMERIKPILSQPRLENNSHYPIPHNGVWVQHESEIVYNDEYRTKRG